METLRDLMRSLLGQASKAVWRRLVCWPPDMFAVLAAFFERTGAYIRVVSPPDGQHWPCLDGVNTRQEWVTQTRLAADQWRAWLDNRYEPHLILGPDELNQVTISTRGAPELILKWVEMIGERLDDLLDDLSNDYMFLCVVQSLLAACDETVSEHLNDAQPAPYAFLLMSALTAHHTMCRFVPIGHAQVLPKYSSPARGIHLRSLSHHLAFVSGEVRCRFVDSNSTTDRTKLTILLIPWPVRVDSNVFRPSIYRGADQLASPYGFFDFDAPDCLMIHHKCLSCA